MPVGLCSHWLNCSDYTAVQISLVLIGTVFWLIAYAWIAVRAYRTGFVEMPYVAAAANIAWEFVWAFVFVTNLGYLFVIGLRAWFFFDLAIFWFSWKYSANQITAPRLKNKFHTVFLINIAVWAIFFVTFKPGIYDKLMGATSAYISQVLMGVLYIYLYFDVKEKPAIRLSAAIATCKLLGTLPMGVFVFLRFADDHFLLTLAIASSLLDILYFILIVTDREKNQFGGSHVKSTTL